MTRYRSISALLFAALLALGVMRTAAAAVHEVGPTTPVVIPISEVIGGTGTGNNAKSNPNGGYYSHYDNIGQYTYPPTHGNQLGDTAMVNDHIWWDSSPGGLDYTHVPHPDAGGGNALWWPIPGEWATYEFNVTAAGNYTVLYRFAAGLGPSQNAVISMTVDGVSSGPIQTRPDNPELWTNTYYQAGGWWGHTMVNGTCPVGWTLAPGRHVLKVSIDGFGNNPHDRGALWLRYFKIMAGGTPVTPPVTVATPTITPNGGTFTAPQSVTLACTTVGTVIRYTLDGSTPTATSPLYSAPFTISALGTTVVKAMAFTATAQSAVASATFILDQVPTVATAASATPNPVSGTTTQLSVLGADNGGETNLSYAWSTTGTPPATVAFSANRSNAAKITTATFSKVGTYTFLVTISDALALSVTSSVTVTVTATPSGITVSPPLAWIEQGSSLTFQAAATDQFGHAIAGTAPITWSTTVGSITTDGVFTAGGSAGTVTVTANGTGGAHGEATVTVTAGFAATINVAPLQSTRFGTMLTDSGLPFANRGNGKSYGWSQDLNTWTRERGGKGSPAVDLAHDTLIYLQRAGNAVFEIAVPDGSYQVRLVCGDGAYADGVHRLAAEGVLVVDGTADASHRWFEGTQTVTVADGRLTITCAAGAMNAKLCLIDITTATVAPFASN